MIRKTLLTRNTLLVFTIISLPFVVGWEKINLTEFLELRRQSIISPVHPRPAIREGLPAIASITPYKIMEKATASFYKTKFMNISIEAWLENTAFHIKTNFNNDIYDLDNYKIDGRISTSLLGNNNFSTSDWVQTYQIRGLSFTWDLNKRKWLPEELNISSKDTNKVLEYSVLSSLFNINEGSVEPSSITLLGREKRQGKDCYVLQYRLERELFKRLGVVADIAMKTWIDVDEFLPRSLRAEGKIADMYILQIVNYSYPKLTEKFSIPPVILEKVNQAKEDLRNKTNVLKQAVSRIRGWGDIEGLKVEFKNRIEFGDFLKTSLEKDYTKDRISQESFIMQWLGLLNKDADYKDSILNSQISSISGLYDPDTKTILLGDWLSPEIAELVFVHELSHSYQDKFVGLNKLLAGEDIKDNFDLAFTYKSFIEGEASAIMLEYLLQKEGRSFKDLSGIFNLIEEKLFKRSAYVRDNAAYNVYGYGANFIQGFLRHNDWQDIDKIYKVLPGSMAEIMHPHMYPLKEGANQEEKQIEGQDSLPGEWGSNYAAKLGEFMIMLSLRQNLEKVIAEKAAAGWVTDELLVYSNKNDKKLIVFLSIWQDQKEALEFFQAYNQWLKKKYEFDMPLEEKEKEFLLQAENKEIYYSKINDDGVVKIIWSDGSNAQDLKVFLDKFDLITKPEA